MVFKTYCIQTLYHVSNADGLTFQSRTIDSEIVKNYERCNGRILCYFGMPWYVNHDFFKLECNP